LSSYGSDEPRRFVSSRGSQADRSVLSDAVPNGIVSSANGNLVIIMSDRIYAKKRSDRNHIVYRITCDVTGESYIGITVMLGRSVDKNLARRWQQHVYRANTSTKEWRLCEALRQHEDWWIECLGVVRGKVAAHALERQLLEQENCSLNSWKKNRNEV
jgi:hypothetical protein